MVGKADARPQPLTQFIIPVLHIFSHIRFPLQAVFGGAGGKLNGRDKAGKVFLHCIQLQSGLRFIIQRRPDFRQLVRQLRHHGEHRHCIQAGIVVVQVFAEALAALLVGVFEVRGLQRLLLPLSISLRTPVNR